MWSFPSGAEGAVFPQIDNRFGWLHAFARLSFPDVVRWSRIQVMARWDRLLAGGAGRRAGKENAGENPALYQ